MMNIALPPGKHDLASAIAEADIRVLLMVLVHMSGDLRWLEPPYAPQGYRMFRSRSTRKLSSQAARLSLPRKEVFVSG